MNVQERLPRAQPARHVLAAWAVHWVIVLIGVLGPIGDAPARLSITGTWLDNFLQWDSQWFVDIARYGYVFPLYVQKTFIPTGNSVPFVPHDKAAAFLPGLPILVHALGIGGAWVLTNLLFGLDLALAYAIAEEEWKGAGFPAVLLLAANPCAIIFSSIYTETYTLTAFLLILWGLERPGDRRRLAVACLGAFLAPSFHDLGAFAILFALRLARSRRFLSALLFTACFCVTPALYALYMWHRFGTPFALLAAEASWHRHWTWPFVNVRDAIAQGAFTSVGVLTVFVIGLLCVQGGLAIWRDRFLLAPRDGRMIDSLESGLWMWCLAALDLCANMPHNPLESTLRFASVTYPATSGIARSFARRPTSALFWIALLAFATVGVLGAGLFSHGWFFQ